MPRLPSRWTAALVGLLAALAAGSPARAAFQLEFDRASYVVQANGTVAVSVFLRETVTSLLASQGLIAADLRLVFNEAPRATDPAQVIARTPNSAFDSPAPAQPTIVAATATTSGVADIIQSSLLIPVTPPSSDPGRILLGQFVFQAGSTPGQVTSLRAADVDPSADGFVLGDGTVLDGQILNGLATIVVASVAVPEPPSLAILASSAPMALGLAFRARRRAAAGGRVA